jgi:hypothetical protein
LPPTGFRSPQSRVKVFPFIGSFSMSERRQSPRDKVIYGGIAEIAGQGGSKDCVVRNISDKGARLEFNDAMRTPRESLRLTIARKGRSFLARIIWWRDNFVGVAFCSEYDFPRSDLARRLRQSEKKKRQLQRRIRELIGES